MILGRASHDLPPGILHSRRLRGMTIALVCPSLYDTASPLGVWSGILVDMVHAFGHTIYTNCAASGWLLAGFFIITDTFHAAVLAP